LSLTVPGMSQYCANLGRPLSRPATNARAEVLRVLRPHIFFDDQRANLEPAKKGVPVAEVPAELRAEAVSQSESFSIYIQRKVSDKQARSFHRGMAEQGDSRLESRTTVARRRRQQARADRKLKLPQGVVRGKLNPRSLTKGLFYTIAPCPPYSGQAPTVSTSSVTNQTNPLTCTLTEKIRRQSSGCNR